MGSKHKKSKKEKKSEKGKGALSEMVPDVDEEQDHKEEAPPSKKKKDKKKKRRLSEDDKESPKKAKTSISEEGAEDDGDEDQLAKDKPNFYSTNKNDTFSSLPLSEKTQAGLDKMGFTRMTQIQSLAIPPLLTGKGKTCSGRRVVIFVFDKKMMIVTYPGRYPSFHRSDWCSKDG